MPVRQFEVPPALVLHLGDAPVSLWDPQVNGLIDDVEERLDSVFVTFATASSGSPSLRDALGAVQFAGCSSAVVVTSSVSGTTSSNHVLPESQMPLVEACSAWSSEAIAEAYQQHRGLALKRQAAAA